MSEQLLTEVQQKRSQRLASNEGPRAPVHSLQRGLHPTLELQRALGNRRFTQLIQSKRLKPEGAIRFQRKLTVGAANDSYEQEADRVARQVMNTSVATDSTQRAMASEEDKDQTLQTKSLAASITRFVQRQMVGNGVEEETIQGKSANALTESFEADTDVETLVGQSKGHGSPLPDPVRAYMEPRFGMDFSHVQVHTGSDALQMNQAVGAQAFTHGSDIYFGADRNPTNLELTAHELTHVIQQTGSTPIQTKDRGEEVVPPGAQRSIQRICEACAADDVQKE